MCIVMNNSNKIASFNAKSTPHFSFVCHLPFSRKKEHLKFSQMIIYSNSNVFPIVFVVILLNAVCVCRRSYTFYGYKSNRYAKYKCVYYVYKIFNKGNKYLILSISGMFKC